MLRNGTIPTAAFLVCIGALLLTPAYAVDIMYDTTGSFNGSNPFTQGTLTILFSGGVFNVDAPNPPDATNAQFGIFTVTGPAIGAQNVNTAFQLSVNQIAPAPGGTEVLDSNKISGRITKSQSKLVVVFSPVANPTLSPTVNPVDGVTPALAFSFGSTTYFINEVTPLHPQLGGATSTINGAISAVPEPSFYALTGAGFVTLVLLAIRKRRHTA